MERLTYRDENGKAWTKLKTDSTLYEQHSFSRASLDKLAEYEDTGLTPKQINLLKGERYCGNRKKIFGK